ncbi:MAG: 16S rRNA (uracil(1498)-N(3))-methyltransferase, partial [Thermoanaerobaculia bacterium]
MNLVLIFDDDFLSPTRVRLTGRRREHVRSVHRAAVGDDLVVGVIKGRIGRGTITRLDTDALEMDVTLDR